MQGDAVAIAVEVWLVGSQGPWMERQALHAASLRLKHPATGNALQLIGKNVEPIKAPLHTQSGWLDHYQTYEASQIGVALLALLLLNQYILF